ncbi:MAG: zinc transport system ATP-binding protein [Candidatus Cloacimonadota bacterium]|jgi:zinc transport system ATP-binding protein|nr:zinc transport system ATP-binding protein [Candidatus Cloacimonadota bacterium]
MNKIIKIENLSYSYDFQPSLKNINLEVEENDFMAILGPNGGGKTTLLKIILGFLQPDSGKIEILGTTPQKARRHIGYVPQYAQFDSDFPIKVKEVVMMSCLQNNSFFPKYPQRAQKKAIALLKKLQIENIAEKRLGELSGGQKQRTLIARALMTDPKILLLDEPTASIDSSIEKDIYDTLEELNKNTTILLVSHDIAFVSSYVNKVTCLNVRSCTHYTKDIKGEKLQQAYMGSIKALEHGCNL